MSITAEKIEEALAYLESEYSIKECCGHPVGGNGPEDEPACCAQPDLYLRSDKVKETILSLLQQGEPDGWKLVPKKPTERMRQRGGEYNCPTITLTSASNYAVDVYAAMIEVAPTFPVMVSEPNDTANHDGADHVGRTGGSIPPTGAMLSASPLPPAPVQGWRPIETAPKDGTKIITFAPDGGIEVSFYYADTLENGTAYETWRDDGCEPTHWMPLPPAPGAETGERKDHLADLVGRFSVALLEKLRAAEKKYGYDNGWLYDDWAYDLRRDLRKHIDKGDPLDVAAYCAFAWHHGWSTSSSGTSYRRAVLEEAAKLVKSFWITAEYDHIGDADVLESVCMQASEAILDLDTTPPAEGETK